MKRTLWLTALSAVLTAACTIGPNYRRPSVAAPAAFKESPPDGFKQAEPSDALKKGKWWEIYEDPALNALEERVRVSNQNLMASEAQFRQAKAAVLVARSGLYPTVTASASAAGGQSAGLTGTVAGRVGSTYIAAGSASWEPDFWGNLRREITSAATTAEASFADLENARLLFQTELAQDYFQLHGIDTEMDLLERTASSYMEYLTLTRNRFAGGVASDLDVAQAESQLTGVQSTLIDLGVERAQLEHGIAILTGNAPAELTIPPALLTAPPPPIPVGVPAELLERRPDIAASERRVAAANEQIGIAMAAFYPNVTLSATGGFESIRIASWFSLPSRIWSVGPTLAQTLFDAGRRKAVVAEERAAYDATVATYRQTVLDAFQQVEDNLAALRILDEEQAKVQETIQSATRALRVSTAQYRAGTTTYLTVITGQASLLTAEDTATQVLIRRLTSSVLLIQALGGGWDSSRVPEIDKLSTSAN